jgi:hypothetical protein
MPRTAHRAFAASLMLACIPLPAAVAMAVAATVVARRLAATVAAPLPVAMAAVPPLPGIKPTIPKQRPQAPRTSLRAAHVPICHAHTQILEQRWGRRGWQRQRCCCRASLLDPRPLQMHHLIPPFRFAPALPACFHVCVPPAPEFLCFVLLRHFFVPQPPPALTSAAPQTQRAPSPRAHSFDC